MPVGIELNELAGFSFGGLADQNDRDRFPRTSGQFPRHDRRHGVPWTELLRPWVHNPAAKDVLGRGGRRGTGLARRRFAGGAGMTAENRKTARQNQRKKPAHANRTIHLSMRV